MMREMKDHELDWVVGGRSGGEPQGQADKTSCFNAAKFTEKHLAVPAKAAPFLLPELNPAHKNGFTRPPRNLTGGQRKQTRKGGPFTFKTPYLNR